MEGAGVISGFDMTSEAALAKLSYVLGQPGLSLDDRKEVRALWGCGQPSVCTSLSAGSQGMPGAVPEEPGGRPRVCPVWEGEGCGSP